MTAEFVLRSIGSGTQPRFVLNNGAETAQLRFSESLGTSVLQLTADTQDVLNYSTDTGNLQIGHASTTISLLSGATPYGRIIKSTNDLILEGAINTGQIILRARDTGGVQQNILTGNPDGAATLYHDGVAVVRTATIASGGLEIDTGSGFERVLTVSDSSGSSNSFETITVTDTDTGFTWTDTGSAVANISTDTLTLVSGVNMDVDVDATSQAIRISTKDFYTFNAALSSSPATNSLWMDNGTVYANSANALIWENAMYMAGPEFVSGSISTGDLVSVQGDSGYAGVSVYSNTYSWLEQIQWSKSAAANQNDGAVSSAHLRTVWITGGPTWNASQVGDETGLYTFDAGATNSFVYGRVASLVGIVEQVNATNVGGGLDIRVHPGTGVARATTSRMNIKMAGEIALGTDVWFTFDEHSSAPATPAAGRVALYAKTDGQLYTKDDAGTEINLTTSGLTDLTDVTLTSPATGGILYKSAGDWIDTDAIVVDPTADVSIKHNAVTKISTTAEGADVFGTLIDLYEGSASIVNIVQRNTSASITHRMTAAGNMQLYAGDGAGTLADLMIEAKPNNAVDLYYNGTRAFSTKSTGAEVIGSLFALIHTSPTASLRVFGSTGGIQIGSNSSGGVIRQTSAAGAVEDTWIDFARDAGVDLYYNNVLEVSTVQHDANYTTSGLRVKDHSGTLRDVGWNVMPVAEIDVDTTFDETHVSQMVHRDDTASITYTLPSGTSGAIPPVGATIMITNENGTGTVTISAAGTLRYFSGAGTPATGNRTLAEGGVATVYHYSDTEWWVWGVGIS